MKMWKKAAKKGHPKAEFSLGYCYANGVGVEKNISKAERWYLEAAEKGVADAQYNLGLLYLKGDDDLAKYEKAANMFLKAAEQGHVRAMNNLAYCYARIGPVPHDSENPDVIFWLKAAADKGYWKAKEAYDEWAKEVEEDEREAENRRRQRMQRMHF